MPQISQEKIDQILSTANIVDVISEFVSLKRKGVNYVGCCPFHNEKTPSFVVSSVKGIYKCFGCSKGGNVVQFMMDHETWSFPEALHYLAKQYKIDIPQIDITPEEKAKNDARESIKTATAWAMDYFKNNLADEQAQQYIAKRGINADMVAKFHVGFAQSDWKALYSCAKMKQFPIEVLLNSCLVSKSEKGYFDRFHSRLMLPFLDLYGNPIGFTGRQIVDNKNEAKYLNTSDTEIFKKGNTLFGLFQAKKAITAADECFLVEGNLDVISMHQCKIENTVCGSGTALTVEQIRLIRRFTNNVTVIYDGDAPGIKAALKNIDLLLQEDINVRAIRLPDGEDPDSFCRKTTIEKLPKWLHLNRKDFITFKYEFLKELAEKDPIVESEMIKDLLHSVSIIPDPITRDRYKKQCIDKFKVAESAVNELVKKQPKKAKDVVNGWIGLDWNTDNIKDLDEVFITSDIQKMYVEWEENENTISYAGDIKPNHLQELNRLSENVVIIDAISALYDDNGNVKPIIALCKKLFEFNFNIKITRNNKEEGEYQQSFLQAYFDFAYEYIDANKFDDDKKTKAIEQAAELFSKADNTTININCKTYASKLGLKEADFKKIIKPYQEKHKSKTAVENEVVDEKETMRLDPDRLPEYVDRDFFAKWGYFPYQNKKEVPVRYVFRTEQGGLQVIGNFYIEPLFHVYNTDQMRNKRIIKVNNAEQNRSYYMEINSSAMVEFGMFKKMLWNEGGNVFTKGKANHHETILASIANKFPLCWELETFGQQPEGFWAFSNAIFADGKAEFMNDLGLITYKDKSYYSPAYSKIFSGHRADNDKYDKDRYFIYRENSETSFEEWASLMNEVYKLNHNGKWAILFTIMAAFRSIIYPIDRLFTSLFCIGATESGKSQIAISCRSVYMKYDAPLFNLNSGSDAAFFTRMERFRDTIEIFEEYNDNEITDVKFQGLKAAVYDGEGKQKRKDATSKDIDISKVNVVPFLLGQEAPERDDGSLGNRCILLNVPKKDDWTEEETNLFQELKQREKNGLSNVLIDILNQRPHVIEHFKKIQRSVFKELKEDMSSSGDTYQTRILNTVSLFLAICKLWEVYAKDLKLSFTYNDFYQVAKAKIIAQSEAIISTNRLSVFFDTLELMLNRPFNGLTPGKEYKIEHVNKLTIQKNRNETEEINLGFTTKILFLRLNILHPMYADIRKNEALKLNNLQNYLKDHKAFIGSVKSTRFEWEEIQLMADELDGGKVKNVSRLASLNTSATAFYYDELGLDLEKFTTPAGTITYTNDDKPILAQKELQFVPAGDPVEDLPF